MRLVSTATGRLIALHLVLVSLAMAAMLAVLHWSTVRVIEGELRDAVAADAQDLARIHAERGVIGLVGAVEERVIGARGREGVYLLAGPGGRRMAGNLAGWPPTIAPDAGWTELELYRTDGAGPARMLALAGRLPTGERLLVGRDAGVRGRMLAALGSAAAQTVAAAVVISIVTGWLLSRLVLGRIAEIDRTARSIVSGNLTRRMPERGSGDEFDRLSRTLNGMLDRIETLVQGLRTVTDSLAHDLRHPLTRLRGQTERLADPDLPEAERAAVAARAASEAEAMLATFSALVEIARAEAGVGREEFVALDLADLAGEAAELYEPALADRGLALEIDAAPAPVSGQAALLRQALSNLLENALAHAADGTTVRIGTGTAGGEAGPVARIAVADRGPGIPEADREAVLERFAVRGSGQGTGLGLALVRAVAALHGGRVTLSDNAPGLRVEIALPLRARDGSGRRGAAR